MSNKEKAISFYQTAFNGEPKKAVELYVGDEYLQQVKRDVQNILKE